MNEIKDINGKGLQLSAENIQIPALGKSLAQAIRDRDIQIPISVESQIKSLQDTHAFISNVVLNVSEGDGSLPVSGSATFSNGTLTISLSNIKGKKGKDGDNGYIKPSTGIPLDDLASDIKTSLSKADTALQPTDCNVKSISISGTKLIIKTKD